MTTRIEIKGKVIRDDRKAHRQRQQRRRPVKIIWVNGVEEYALGAEIDGILRLICRPREEPFIEVDGAVMPSDPQPCLSEPRGYVRITRNSTLEFLRW